MCPQRRLWRRSARRWAWARTAASRARPDDYRRTDRARGPGLSPSRGVQRTGSLGTVLADPAGPLLRAPAAPPSSGAGAGAHTRDAGALAVPGARRESRYYAGARHDAGGEGDGRATAGRGLPAADIALLGPNPQKLNLVARLRGSGARRPCAAGPPGRRAGSRQMNSPFQLVERAGASGVAAHSTTRPWRRCGSPP